MKFSPPYNQLVLSSNKAEAENIRKSQDQMKIENFFQCKADR